MFTAEATGTEPLNYQWLHWKLAGEGGGSGEWQPCPAEWCDGATLTIPSVQKSNEGWYHCVISNYAGAVISKPARLSVGKTTRFLYTGTYHLRETHTVHTFYMQLNLPESPVIHKM